MCSGDVLVLMRFLRTPPPPFGLKRRFVPLCVATPLDAAHDSEIPARLLGRKVQANSVWELTTSVQSFLSSRDSRLRASGDAAVCSSGRLPIAFILHAIERLNLTVFH
jgi:hypothetical protein